MPNSINFKISLYNFNYVFSEKILNILSFSCLLNKRKIYKKATCYTDISLNAITFLYIVISI